MRDGKGEMMRERRETEVRCMRDEEAGCEESGVLYRGGEGMGCLWGP